MTIGSWRARCRFLQPNHFGVLALPVGEFLGLLHGAVYVGAHAVDGDLSHVPAKRGEPEHHQFFASKGDSHKAQVLLPSRCAESCVLEPRAAWNSPHRQQEGACACRCRC